MLTPLSTLGRTLQVLQVDPESRAAIRRSMVLAGGSAVFLLISSLTALVTFAAIADLLCFHALVSLERVFPLLVQKSDSSTFGNARVGPVSMFASAVFVAFLTGGVFLGSIEAVFSKSMLDAFSSILIGSLVIMQCVPLGLSQLPILLQATPNELLSAIEKCSLAINAMDGVLEIRDSHFWALSKGNYVGTLVIRISMTANPQQVLTEVHKLFAPYIGSLSVQCQRDEWGITPLSSPNPNPNHPGHANSASSSNDPFSTSNAASSSMSDAPAFPKGVLQDV
eukprot:ANDGO_01558.mRNA.1 metal tolerance protein